MAKGGTYGDNMEISAFSAAYDVNVKIYQRDFAYMVSGGGTADDSRRNIAHIAYHVSLLSVSSSRVSCWLIEKLKVLGALLVHQKPWWPS